MMLYETLDSAFDRYMEALDAATVPVADGGRGVLDAAGAVVLSEATYRLYGALADEWARLVRTVGKRVTGPPPGIVLTEADSPDGPFTPIPPGQMITTAIPVGGDGANAAVVAAIQRASGIAAFPLERWNAAQKEAPGAGRHRYRAGDVVSAQELDVLASVARLLRLRVATVIDSVGGPDTALGVCRELAEGLPPTGPIDTLRRRLVEARAAVDDILMSRWRPPDALFEEAMTVFEKASAAATGIAVRLAFGMEAPGVFESRLRLRLREGWEHLDDAQRRDRKFDPDFLMALREDLSLFTVTLLTLARPPEPERHKGGPSDDGTQRPDAAAELKPIPDKATLSVAELAGYFGVPQEALRKRLERWRKEHDDGWVETTNRKTRDPSYLYEVGAVRPVIEELRASGGASGQRPTT
jgi:hypothetical protein